MKIADYLKLGLAGVRAHKKRALIVVVIVGLLFSAVIASIFVLSGLENATLVVMLEPTGGKVLVMTNVDMAVCGDECDLQEQVQQIKASIKHYSGRVIKAEAYQEAEGIFYQLEDDILGAGSTKEGVTSVAVPLTTAEKLRGIEIAEILPSGTQIGGLRLSDIGQENNPLDLLLAQIQLGTSQNFIIKSDATTGTNTEEMGLVFAEFADIKTAFDYYKDEANNCSGSDQVLGRCTEEYKYQVRSAISEPLVTYGNFQEMWSVLKVIMAVLGIVAIIIILSTYARLMGKDMKIIALYHAMGATKWQIRAVYTVYLMMLSVMAVIFALMLGLVLVLILSSVNMAGLEEVFTLGFGVETGPIWLLSWNNLIWYIIGAMIFAAIVAVCLGNGNFSSKELARKLK